MTSTVELAPITGQLVSVLADANGFASNSAWSNKYATFGPNTLANPQAAALALGYDVTGNAAGIVALAPGSAWELLTLNCSSLQVRISGGTSLLTVAGSGAIQAPTSPLTAATTQAFTGLAGLRTSDNPITSNATLTADASLTLTFNETGHYAFEVWLAFWETTSGAGGFQFDFNSGTSTIAKLSYELSGFSTSAIALTAGITSVSTANSQVTIGTAAATPSWFLAKGWMNVSVAGTRAIRVAQNNSSANATTLLTGSYFTATKIG